MNRAEETAGGPGNGTKMGEAAVGRLVGGCSDWSEYLKQMRMKKKKTRRTWKPGTCR